MTLPDLPGAGRAGDQGVRHLLQVGPDGAARDVLAEPGDQRRAALRTAAVDVAEAHQAAALVRDLDADGLLARDRRQDPDVGRGQRVGQVVLERGDLRDLGARSELELVAAHVRPGDGADDLRLNAEVSEGLQEVAGDRLVILLVGALLGRTALQDRLRRRDLVVDLLGLGDAAALLPHRGELQRLLLRRLLGLIGLNGLLIGDHALGDPESLVLLLEILELAGVGLVRDADGIVEVRDLLGLRLVSDEDLEVVPAGDRLRRAEDRLGVGGGGVDQIGVRVDAALLDRGREADGAALGALRTAARGADHVRHRTAGQHQGPGNQEHDGDDVGPDPVEKRAGRPVKGLPQTTAVMREEVGVEQPLAHPLRTEAGGLRRQGEQKPGGNCRHTDRDRLRRWQERPQDQADSRETKSDGDNYSARANGIVERRLRTVADGAPVPSQIDDVPQIDRQADAAEARQVEPALHHLGRGPAAGSTSSATAATRCGLALPPARRLPLAPGRISPLRRAENAVCKHAPT